MKPTETMFDLSRRSFLTLAAATATGCATRRPESTVSATPARPNVLFIICDDLNDTIAGMGGHPQARTPNINRLMQQGVQFNNAHCNAPICAPSRCSLLTGLLPSTTGYYGYKQQQNHWRKYPAMHDAKTIMEHFRDNGYRVYGAGKIFHNGHEDKSVWEWPEGGTGYVIHANFGPWPVGQRGHPSMPPGMRDYKFESFGPLSDIPHFPAEPEKGLPAQDGWQMWHRPFRYVNEDDRDLMPDEQSAKWASARLHEAQDKPFFMAIGMNRPHRPRYAPAKYFDLFPLDEVQLPPYRKDDLEDCAEILWKNPDTGEVLRPCRELQRILDCGGIDIWRRNVQSYLACVAFVDDQVGKILDALESSDYADNTIVILTGDHGFHLGEKENLYKRTIWEESTRVPLVIKAPGVSQSDAVCPHPVSLIDMYPTLNDLCGLPPEPNKYGNGMQLDGHSLRPFLVKPHTDRWDGPPVALNCLYGPKELDVLELGKVEDQHFSVRSKRWRYTLCCNGEEELYDHKTDPNEWINLAHIGQYERVKKKLKRELLRLTGRAT